ncbi:MAG TPA: hypothetical protein DCQ14_01055 [Firmicutes bacterium]|nr:hypothetical protein [Bacillota bacterium]
MGEVKEYVLMTLPEIEALDRKRSVFLLAISPIEVHGPHLPLGTDVFIALTILDRYIKALQEEFPAYTLVKLPPLYLGADALPVKGSLFVPAPLLREVLLSYVKGLAVQGFRYLFLADNHGGPRHQLSIETACRKAWRKYRFHMVNPFNLEFRMMVQHDPQLLAAANLQPGKCGDDPDCHAGTNETSLMLASHPEKVWEIWREVVPSLPHAESKPILFLSKLIGIFNRTLGLDLRHLAATLAWVGDREMKPYMGAPALASPEAGEAMLSARVNIAMECFRRALQGEPVHLSPLLWGLRFLR